MISIVDTDAIIGLVSPADPLHQRAKRVSQGLQERDAYLVVSPTTLAEFSLVGQRWLGLTDMKKSLGFLLQDIFITETIGVDAMHMAKELLEKQQSINHSFCDCCVMALAARLHADCIFSFDLGYTKNGFVLAEEYLKKTRR